ncbi:MAG: gliding motility-associated C-terminal domain-containing protein, partial [Capnocytophaga sp.]|nr:gliding motility-associated C-terminal domain-containing protein [Capnocytophaga sp.]
KYPLTKNSEDFTTKKYPTTKNIGDFTNKNTLPEVEFPTFSGGCNPKITYKDQIIDKKCENQYTIQRTFTLSDECNQPLTYTQYIKIEDNTPPTFVGTLPKDTSVSSNQIPEQAEVTAIDSCNGGVTIQKLREEIKDANQNIIKVIYKWIASDVCGNKSTHTQVISITQEPLELLTTPSDITLNCNEPMPDVVFPTFKGGCSPNISYKEEIVDRKCDNQYTLLRTFTISDRCNNSVVYSQRIYKVANLTFELGTLPPKNTESTLSSLPPQGEISASNSCAGNISIRKYQKQVLDSQHQVVKVLNNWVASDDCGNEITYTQVVSILPEPSKPENTTPSDSQQANEPIVYNAVSTSNDSMNYFKIENVDTSYPIYLDIFNELGQLVYHSSNYQKNGEVFKGYANVRNAISKGSLLESGVYFYVLKYHSPKGEAIKKGFLFIR